MNSILDYFSFTDTNDSLDDLFHSNEVKFNI